MANRAEIAAILKTLASAYPGQRLERPTLQAYLERLGDIPAHLLAAAAEAHIAQAAWFPKISPSCARPPPAWRARRVSRAWTRCP